MFTPPQPIKYQNSDKEPENFNSAKKQKSFLSAGAGFTRISSFILAVLLFLAMLNAKNNPYIYAASVLVLIFAAFIVNFKRLSFTWPHLLLPTTYILAVSSVFMVITNPTARFVFLLLSSLTFFGLELRLGKESHFLQNIYLISAFGLYLGMFAVRFYFNVSSFIIVPISFVLTYIFSLQGLSGFSLPAKKYFYFLLAALASEMTLGLMFWPAHFFVDAVVLFSFFYLLWLFSFSAFFGKLSRQKIYWQLILVAIVLILTLATAAWKPIG